jgi:hypothetical protein
MDAQRGGMNAQLAERVVADRDEGRPGFAAPSRAARGGLGGHIGAPQYVVGLTLEATIGMV